MKSSSTKKTRRWVVKAGSQMVCEGGALLIRSWMQQVLELREKFGIEVIWVTSGAIAMAARRTRFNNTKKTLAQKQALSAIGQPMVMDYYNLALQSQGLLGSQVLLTAGDIKDPVRRRNLQNTLKELLHQNVVPILNENDAIATEEIRFGDNDNLSARIAVMTRAERLIILTDVDGLYEADPKLNPNAKLIAYRKKLTASDLKLADKKSKSTHGTGGMVSKLQAAKRASESKIITHLIKGDFPNNLIQIAKNSPPGTQIGGKPQ